MIKGFKFNKSNWITLETLIKTITKYRNMEPYKTDIIVTPFGSTANKDRILILNHYDHCYVILHYVKKKVGYIADGVNECYYNQKTFNDIQSYTDFKLIAVQYERQTKVDHCGGSGICIVLSFMQ